jgi:hypothetical protein
VLLSGGLALAEVEATEKNEIGLLLGAISTPDRSTSGQGGIGLTRNVVLQANYGRKFWEGSGAALFGEVHFAASPLQEIKSSNPSVARDYASLFVAPGVRLKLAPRSTVSPYFAVGGGYALFEQSLNVIGGGANPGPRFTHRGAFMFGAGVDVRAWRFLSFRGEVRDFYSGNPTFNVPVSGGQHNMLTSGGIVLRWGN